MKLKYKFMINEVADQKVAVPISCDIDTFNGLIKLNDEGVSIFKLLENDINFEEIVSSLKNEYPEATETEIETNVKQFIDKLRTEGLVE